MNIYRHKVNKQLYILEHLVHDIRFFNNGAFEGIHAHPYLHKGDVITHLKGDIPPDDFNPHQFVSDNFDIAAELHFLPF